MRQTARRVLSQQRNICRSCHWGSPCPVDRWPKESYFLDLMEAICATAMDKICLCSNLRRASPTDILAHLLAVAMWMPGFWISAVWFSHRDYFPRSLLSSFDQTNLEKHRSVQHGTYQLCKTLYLSMIRNHNLDGISTLGHWQTSMDLQPSLKAYTPCPLPNIPTPGRSMFSTFHICNNIINFWTPLFLNPILVLLACWPPHCQPRYIAMRMYK
ncbi:hypothetical protein BDW67DRAFT_41535 [Aspergillus spinulosporus]